MTANSIRLRHLVDQAEYWYSTLGDYVFRHTTIQVVVLGWALTSSGARERVDDLGVGGVLIALLPLAYSALVLVIFRRIEDRSDIVMRRIAELDLHVWDDVQAYEIGANFWLGMGLVHVALSLLITFLLLTG